jgi:hypothetical protein
VISHMIKKGTNQNSNPPLQHPNIKDLFIQILDTFLGVSFFWVLQMRKQGKESKGFTICRERGEWGN